MECDLIMTAADMEASREKWLEVRRDSIGGSEAAAIMGLSPWKSAYTLWLEKTGQLQEENKEENKADNEAVHFGSLLENIVAAEFCHREGKKVKKCGLYRSREFPFLTGSFDRLVIGENAGLECKTTSAYARDKWDDGQIPPAYYVQCQHYMLVSGLPRWYIACLVGGNHFVSWIVERDEKDIATLLEAEQAFWDKVQRGVMPDIDGSDSTTSSLKEIYKGGSVEPITLPASTSDLLQRWDELKRLETDLKGQKQEVQNKLCALLGDNEVGIVGEGEAARKVSWKTTAGRTTIDTKALKADLPDVFEKYSKAGSSSRRFTA